MDSITTITTTEAVPAGSKYALHAAPTPNSSLSRRFIGTATATPTSKPVAPPIPLHPTPTVEYGGPPPYDYGIHANDEEDGALEHLGQDEMPSPSSTVVRVCMNMRMGMGVVVRMHVVMVLVLRMVHDSIAGGWGCVLIAMMIGFPLLHHLPIVGVMAMAVAVPPIGLGEPPGTFGRVESTVAVSVRRIPLSSIVIGHADAVMMVRRQLVVVAAVRHRMIMVLRPTSNTTTNVAATADVAGVLQGLLVAVEGVPRAEAHPGRWAAAERGRPGVGAGAGRAAEGGGGGGAAVTAHGVRDGQGGVTWPAGWGGLRGFVVLGGR